MNIWPERITTAGATVAAVVLTYAGLYQWGMGAYEGEPVSYVQALQVVIEAITTAGFGGHAPWSSGAMNALVLAMNLTGVLFVFLAVPLFVVPLFREVLKTHPPTRTEATDHVIICAYTPRGEAFIAELQSRGRPYVLIEPDRDTARTLHEDGYDVIVGDPESTRVLEQANIDAATGVVADAEDDVNASIALSVREVNADVRVVTLVEDATLEPYHRLAGADVVLSPRQLLGESLARQVPTVMTTAMGDGVEIGGQVELVELKVEPGSTLSEQTVRTARLRERFGIDVIGAWEGGDFMSPVDAEVQLRSGMRLLVAGAPDQIGALREVAVSTIRRFAHQPVVIAGYGRAGEAAASALGQTNTPVVVLDREARQPVDIVGDVRDPQVLEAAEIDHAAAAIITVDDDTTAIFATLIMRELNPDLYIIVRANREEDEQKLYRAGADYVQSLATVSGRMMASTILEDEQVFTFGAQIEIVQLPAGGLGGQTLADADVHARAGVTVLAVVRGTETLTNLDPEEFEFEDEDAVVIAGTSANVRRFETQYLN